MSNGALNLHYSEPPGFAGIYRRLLFGRRARYESGTPLPAFQATWKGARAERDRISRYCAACGLEDDGYYPLLYPHVLTSAIHIDIISQREFPLSPMGAVHTRMHILQYRPIPAENLVDVHCALTGYRVLKAGLEFEITTTLSDGNGRFWESVSANLIRGKKFGEPEEPSPLGQLIDLETESETLGWDVPRDMGWKYAKITGDFNPIHVSRVLAKFMGFDRDLIHGMWSAARCLSHLNQPKADQPIRLDLLFKGPVYMESEVTLKSMHAGAQAIPEDRDAVDSSDPLSGGDTDQRFDLYCGDNPRPVIQGHLRQAEPGAALVT